MPRIVYSQQVEVLVQPNTAGGQLFNFADQPQLRNKVVTGLEIYNANDITTSLTTPGSPVITAAEMSISFLTLFLIDPVSKRAIGEQIKNMPLVSLHRTQLNTTATASPYVMSMFEWNYIVSWDKCYISVAQPGITTTTNTKSFLLNVYYKDA